MLQTFVTIYSTVSFSKGGDIFFAKNERGEKMKKLSNEQREELMIWAEDRLQLYRVNNKWKQEEEMENKIETCDDLSKEKREGWIKLKDRLGIQEGIDKARRKRAKLYAELSARIEEQEPKNNELYALMPKYVKRTIKDKDEFMQGIMSKKTLKRLKILCLRCRAILLFQEE